MKDWPAAVGAGTGEAPAVERATLFGCIEVERHAGEVVRAGKAVLV